MDKLYIVMPAYNEEANIEKTIEEWYPIITQIGNGSKLVIVDDGSKDSTYETMKVLQERYPNFIPLTKLNSGHGATCLYAYRYALLNQSEYIFQTDSDGQTCPSEFWAMWNDRNKYGFIIGSRTDRQDGFSRIIVTKVLQLVVWLTFGVFVEDANTPFRLMKSDCLKRIMEYIPNNFFLSNVAISALAVLMKEKIKWIPITFKPRQGGVNSINLKRIFKIGMKAVSDFRMIKKI
ncbi:MAG: glycosyltransferase family 2 protein [Parabacteroides sp.]|nr:glycosyltransferase family 2 protein [Parabacteroides sp.]